MPLRTGPWPTRTNRGSMPPNGSRTVCVSSVNKKYYLPDMKNMQVKLGLHESVINRVKTGQTVSIRLDAFADQKLMARIVCCGTGREQFFGHKELRCDCTDRQCSIRDCIETRYDCRGRDTRRHLHRYSGCPRRCCDGALSAKLRVCSKGEHL